MFKNLETNQKARLLLALLLLVLIYFVVATQDGVFKTDSQIKQAMQPKDLLAKRSPILQPGNIKGYMFPSKLRYRNNQWMRTYYSNPSTHLMTQLYSELSEKIPGKPRFSSEKYMSSAKYRFENNKGGYEKEKSLFYLEQLYKLTGNEEYLAIFFEESEEFVQELKGLRTLRDSRVLRDDVPPYYLLRMLSYRVSVLKIDESFNNLYRSYLIFRGTRDLHQSSSVVKQCSFLWASVPLLKGDPDLLEQATPLINKVKDRFIETLKTNIFAFEGIQSVLSCLDAFTDLEKELEIDVDSLFNIAYQSYLIHAFNYPRKQGCPPSGGFFAEPPLDRNCREVEMELSHNVLLDIILYKLSR